MLKKFSSTDNVIDRNSVRNAEAFKKSRLLFREDSTEIADEAAPWTKKTKNLNFTQAEKFVLFICFLKAS